MNKKINIYNSIYKDLIDDNRVNNSKSYGLNCSIKAIFFVDVVIDNYYYGKKVNDVDKLYLKKSNKYNGYPTHNQNISWIKNFFKIKKIKELTKDFSKKYSEKEVRDFLIEYMDLIISTFNFHEGSKIPYEWNNFLESLNLRYNYEENQEEYDFINNNLKKWVNKKIDKSLKDGDKIKINKILENISEYSRYSNFRDSLMREQKNNCPISELEFDNSNKIPITFLEAAHIISIKSINNKFKNDIELITKSKTENVKNKLINKLKDEMLELHSTSNGILIPFTYHKLFDNNILELTDDGIFLMSDNNAFNNIELLGINKKNKLNEKAIQRISKILTWRKYIS